MRPSGSGEGQRAFRSAQGKEFRLGLCEDHGPLPVPRAEVTWADTPGGYPRQGRLTVCVTEGQANGGRAGPSHGRIHDVATAHGPRGSCGRRPVRVVPHARHSRRHGRLPGHRCHARHAGDAGVHCAWRGWARCGGSARCRCCFRAPRACLRDLRGRADIAARHAVCLHPAPRLAGGNPGGGRRGCPGPRGARRRPSRRAWPTGPRACPARACPACVPLRVTDVRGGSAVRPDSDPASDRRCRVVSPRRMRVVCADGLNRPQTRGRSLPVERVPAAATSSRTWVLTRC